MSLQKRFRRPGNGSRIIGVQPAKTRYLGGNRGKDGPIAHSGLILTKYTEKNDSGLKQSTGDGHTTVDRGREMTEHTVKLSLLQQSGAGRGCQNIRERKPWMTTEQGKLLKRAADTWKREGRQWEKRGGGNRETQKRSQGQTRDWERPQ